MSEKKEYIERGALKDKFRIPDRESVFNLVIAKTPTIEAANIATDMIIEIAGVLRDAVDDEPAADVEPVVRGEWEDHPIADTTDEGEQYVAMFWQCSNCHGKLIYWNFQRTKFCPDCGAHMERSGSGE